MSELVNEIFYGSNAALLIFVFRTDCGFSPRGELVFTGTSTSDDGGIDGALLFFDSSNFELVYQIKYPKLVSCLNYYFAGLFKVFTIFVCRVV